MYDSPSLEDAHLDLWRAESAASAPSPFETWITEVEKTFGDVDGDYRENGYSLDGFHDRWEAGDTPAEAIAAVPLPGHLGHQPTPGKVTAGFEFTHTRMLDTSWQPGPGQKYADAPKVRCRVTKVTPTTVYFTDARDRRNKGLFSVARDEFEATYLTVVRS